MYRYCKGEGKSAWRLIENSERGIKRAIEEGATYYTILSIDQDLNQVPDDDLDNKKIHYKGPLYFDFDSKDDEERTLYDVRRLLIQLYAKYGVSMNDVVVHCTGGKGFHVLVPAKAFCNGKAAAFLPYTYKNMAKEFSLETLDYSIYSGGKGRMWRIENIQRPNKRYKIRLTTAQIFCLSFEEIHELTQSPGLNYAEESKDVEFSAELSALFRASEYKAPKLSAVGVEDEKLRKLHDHPVCMKKMTALTDIQEGRSFNNIMMAFASYGAGMGWKFDVLYTFCESAVEKYESSVYKKLSDKRGHLKSIFGYYITQRNYKFNCNFIRKTVKCEHDCPKCELTAQALDEEYDPTLGIEATESAYFKRQGRDDRLQLSTFVIKPTAIIEFTDHQHREYTICATLKAASGRAQEVIFYQQDWGSRSAFLRKLPHPDFAYVGGDIDVTKIFHLLSQVGEIPKKLGVKCLGMHEIDHRWQFVTTEGSVAGDGAYDEVLLENEYPIYTDLVHTEMPKPSDIGLIAEHLFKFNELPVVVPIVGWFVSAFFKERIFKHTKQFPLLFVFGAAGAGKTQTLLALKNLFALVGDDVKSIADLTQFTLIKAADANNTIPLILDEYKSTTFSVYQIKMVSKLIRAAYNNEIGERGQANQTVTQYRYRSPIILAGEQTVTEPAARDRIIEVQMNKAESGPHLDDFERLKTTPLPKLGKLILTKALSMTDDEVKELLEQARQMVPAAYTDRPKMNYSIMLFGLLMLERLFADYGCGAVVSDAVQRYLKMQPELDKEELYERSKTDVDRIMEAIALMTEHERYRLYPKQHYEIRGNTLIINMRYVYSLYLRFAEEHKVDAEAMNYGSFQRLAKKETYFIKDAVMHNMTSGTALCMEFDIDKIYAKSLNMLSILDSDVPETKPMEV